MESTSNLIFWGFFVVFLFHWVFSLVTYQAQNKIEKGNNTTKTEKNDSEKENSPKEGNIVNHNDKKNFEGLNKQSINLRKRNFCEPNNIHDMDTKSSDSDVLRDHPKRHSPDTPVINNYISLKKSNKHEEQENSPNFSERPFGEVKVDSVFSQTKKNEINIHDNTNNFISKRDYLTNSSISKNCFVDNQINEDTSGLLKNIATPELDKVDEDFKTITDTIIRNVEFPDNDIIFDQSTKTANVVQLEDTVPCYANTIKDSHHLSKGLENMTSVSSNSTSLNSSTEPLKDLTHEVISQTKLATHPFDFRNQEQEYPVEKIKENFNTDATRVSAFTLKRSISKEAFDGTSNDDLSNSLPSVNKTVDNQKEFMNAFESTHQPLLSDSRVLACTTDSDMSNTYVKILTTNEEGVKETTTNKVIVHDIANNDETSVNVVTITNENTVKVMEANDTEAVKDVTISDEKTFKLIEENDEESFKFKNQSDDRTVEFIEESDEESVKVKTITHEKTVELIEEDNGESLKVKTLTDKRTVELIEENNEESLKVKTLTDDRTVERIEENNEEFVRIKTITHEKTVELIEENDEDAVKGKTVTHEKTVELIEENNEESLKFKTLTDDKTVEFIEENDEESVKVKTITHEKTVELAGENDEETVKFQTLSDERTVEHLEKNDQGAVKVETITHEKTVTITTSEPVQRSVTTSGDEIDESILPSESICQSELSDSGTSYQVVSDQYVSDMPINNMESPEPTFQNLEEERQLKEQLYTFFANSEPFESDAKGEKTDNEFPIGFCHVPTTQPEVRTFDLRYEAETGDEYTYQNVNVCRETTGSDDNGDKEFEGELPNKLKHVPVQNEATTSVSNDIENEPSISKLSKNLAFSEDEEKKLECATESCSLNSILNEPVNNVTGVSNDVNNNIMEPSTNKTTYDYDSHNQLHVNNHNDPCVISQAEEHTGAKDTVNVKYMNPKIGITHHSTTSFRPGQNNDSELCQSPLPENNLDSSSSPINVPKTRKVTEVLPETLQNTSDSQDMEKNYKGDEDDPLHLLHKVKRRAIKRLNRFASSTQNETDNQNWETSSFNRFTLDDESNESFDTEEDNDDDDPDNHDSHFKEDVNLAQRLKTEGNDLFKDQAYQAAAIKYTEALKFSAGLEFSGILLCNRAACYLLLKNYRQVIKDCNDGLLLFPSYVKLYLRRFRAYEGLKKWHEALADLDKVLELNPSLSDLYKDLHGKIKNLSELQFEKEKEEMINNLKGFGNWALGKIGLSIDNFKIDKNEATGAYNVSFQNSAS